MIEYISAISSYAKAANQRALLFFSGSDNWVVSQAHSLLAALEFETSLYITDQTLFDEMGGIDSEQRIRVVNPKSAMSSYLGQEFDLVIIDAFSGFNPNTFAALSGTVRSGGFVIILCPVIEKWAEFSDPEYQNIVVYPYSPSDIEGRFLRYFVDVIEASSSIFVFSENGTDKDLPDIGSIYNTKAQSNIFSNNKLTKKDNYKAASHPEQDIAVELIVKTARGRAHRPLVINADRGRGKTAALGIAAAKLVAKGTRVAITSPIEESSAIARKHYYQHLSEIGVELTDDAENLFQFIPPSDVVQQQEEFDLLLVDEAAAIPVGLLEKILYRYPRLVFSTTTQGYEGTGRGFELRFKPLLKRVRPKWRLVTLTQPMRWSEGDPLEEFVNHSLLLDDGNNVNTRGNTEEDTYFYEKVESKGFPISDIEIKKLDRDELVRDVKLLGNLFALLITAHYRTTPGDLRNLLDGPNIDIWIAVARGNIIGAIVVAKEGNIEKELAEEILKGSRRPRGQLLPQILIAQLGIVTASKLSAYRIVRVAVLPQQQRSGLGSMLVNQIVKDARHSGVDYVGSCFGATTELLRFWGHVGLIPARLGASKEKTSGLHSALVLKAISKQSSITLNAAFFRFIEQFPVLIPELYRDVDFELIASLLLSFKERCMHINKNDVFTLCSQDQIDLNLFALENRPYESCLVPLWKATCLSLVENKSTFKNEETRELFIRLLLQKHSIDEIVKTTSFTGKKQIVAALRQGVKSLLDDNLCHQL